VFPQKQQISRNAWLPVACGFALFFLLDALLFRTNLYSSIIQPESYTGRFELTLWRDLREQTQSANLVATLGDSRFSYPPSVMDGQARETGYTFSHAGIAGSKPRDWYYMIRDLDPASRAYRAVVIGMDDFDDEDQDDEERERLLDLRIVINRLRLRDVFEFAGSYRTWPSRWTAFRGALLKGSVYQPDIEEFLSGPSRRMATVKLFHEGWPQWTHDFIPEDHNLAGLSIDWNAWKATYPPGANPAEHELIDGILLRRATPQTGSQAEYRRHWLGRIVDHYQKSATRVIFIRLPRGPVVRPEWLVKKLSSSVRELGRRENVILVDEHRFDSLERPELFKDPLHLNREGATRFAVILSAEIRQTLGPPGRVPR
jgi:hypothetical protein